MSRLASAALLEQRGQGLAIFDQWRGAVLGVGNAGVGRDAQRMVDGGCQVGRSDGRFGGVSRVLVGDTVDQAATDARYVKEKLQEKLQQPIFIDSDDLHVLTKLKTHVCQSDVLVLVQTRSVLTRPYCLVELITACKHGVPIVGVCVSNGPNPYNRVEAEASLSDLDETLEPGDQEQLRRVTGSTTWARPRTCSPASRRSSPSPLTSAPLRTCSRPPSSTSRTKSTQHGATGPWSRL